MLSTLTKQTSFPIIELLHSSYLLSNLSSMAVVNKAPPRHPAHIYVIFLRWKPNALPPKHPPMAVLMGSCTPRIVSAPICPPHYPAVPRQGIQNKRHKAYVTKYKTVQTKLTIWPMRRKHDDRGASVEWVEYDADLRGFVKETFRDMIHRNRCSPPCLP